MHSEDITDRKALETELTHRALHDPLTGLPNRALLLDRIAHALARSQRSGRPTCLFFLDLNGFRSSMTPTGTPPAIWSCNNSANG